jgi:hypothetical protein
LLIGYLDVDWDSSIIFGLLKEGFYNEVVIFFFFYFETYNEIVIEDLFCMEIVRFQIWK